MRAYSDCLFIIPARGGSKGIPGKNIKMLGSKPLIAYSVEYALKFANHEHICVTTDSDEIIRVVEKMGIPVSFKRPDELATDSSGSFEVIKHAIEFYEKKGLEFSKVVLLQPTAPFRATQHFEECYELFDSKTDVVVSVTEESQNPYYNVFEEQEDGFLKVSKGDGNYTRRQDCPKVYSFNGSIYIFRKEVFSFAQSFKDLESIKKYVMEEKYKVDIDTPVDWQFCEFLMANNYFDQ